MCISSMEWNRIESARATRDSEGKPRGGSGPVGPAFSRSAPWHTYRRNPTATPLRSTPLDVDSTLRALRTRLQARPIRTQRFTALSAPPLPSPPFLRLLAPPPSHYHRDSKASSSSSSSGRIPWDWRGSSSKKRAPSIRPRFVSSIQIRFRICFGRVRCLNG